MKYAIKMSTDEVVVVLLGLRHLHAGYLSTLH